MTQHGFFFDQGRCTGCHACSVACKSWHGHPSGPLKFLRIYQHEQGSFPRVRLHFHWIPCYHCEEPACLGGCPSGAIVKEESFGAVLIDEASCNGCRGCYAACPYGAPVFASDAPGSKAHKCTMCIERLRAGLPPVCAAACPQRALDFGPLDELRLRYGDRRELEGLPASHISKPSLVVKPRAEKRMIVKYDVERGLALLMRRDPLPPLFSSAKDVTEIPEGMVGRGELAIKHDSAEELMRRTRNDDG